MVSTHGEGGFWMGWDLHAATLYVFHQRVCTRVGLYIMQSADFLALQSAPAKEFSAIRARE